MSPFHPHSPTSHEIWQLSPRLGTDLSHAPCSVHCSPSVRATAGKAPRSRSRSALNSTCCSQLPRHRDEPSTGQCCPGPSSCLILPARFLQMWQDQSVAELLLGACDTFLHGWPLKALNMMEGGRVCPKREMGHRNCNEILMNLANFQKPLIKHLISHLVWPVSSVG